MQRSTTRTASRLQAGKIRPLRASDLELFREHLLRLDAHSRRDRFNGLTDDEFVAAYAARCFSPGTTITGYLEDGFVRGAAELHELSEVDGLCAEIAFSVEHDWQRSGLGSRLFERLIAHASEIGCRRLRVTTHPQNEAMKALARKFKAKLAFEQGETVGVIDLADLGCRHRSHAGPRRKSRKMGSRSCYTCRRTRARGYTSRPRQGHDGFSLAALGLTRDREEPH